MPDDSFCVGGIHKKNLETHSRKWPQVFAPFLFERFYLQPRESPADEAFHWSSEYKFCALVAVCMIEECERMGPSMPKNVKSDPLGKKSTAALAATG